MSSHLADLPSGGTLQAEVDGDSVIKIQAIASHRNARIASRSIALSGHVLLTLIKD